MSYSVYELAQLFLIYAFLGWCVEVCFVAVTTGQVVNRGFLNGPVCPIYGVGMVGVLLLLEPISDNLVLLFFLGMLLCTAVELVGGWILEKVFHTRWWDYTDQPFNLGGYVCLGFSLMWGLAVTFVVRLIHPLIFSLVSWIPHTLGLILTIVLYVLFVTDFILTLVTIVGMKRKLGELERVAEALHAVGDNISDRLGNSALAADAKLDEVKQNSQEKMAEGRERMESAMESGQKRLEESRERRIEARELRQQKWDEDKERLNTRVTETLQELQERKLQLETRQKELLGNLRNHPRFGARRLYSAFPAMKKSLKEHLDHMDRE